MFLLISRWAGRLWSTRALAWAGVRVSFQSQTEWGHGSRHLRQVVRAQVSLQVVMSSVFKAGTLSAAKTHVCICSGCYNTSVKFLQGVQWPVFWTEHVYLLTGWNNWGRKAEHSRKGSHSAAAFQGQRFHWWGHLNFTLPPFSRPPPWPRSHWPVWRIKGLIPGGSWLIPSSI